MLKLKGLVEVNTIHKDGRRENIGHYPNLLVDDGKEYILDFFGGLKSWHNPSATASGTAGLMTFKRYGALGDSMFHNSSVQRAQGLKGIPTGAQEDYPIVDTQLVSPEDSFLSSEIGNRVQLTVTRRDQTLEFVGRFLVPGDIPSGTQVREFGLFLRSTGPVNDPSFSDLSKPNTMLCRTVLWGSGVVGGTGVYTDNPLTALDDIEIRWKFGEL